MGLLVWLYVILVWDYGLRELITVQRSVVVFVGLFFLFYWICCMD